MRTLLFTLLACTVLFSCKKKDNPKPTTETAPISDSGFFFSEGYHLNTIATADGNVIICGYTENYGTILMKLASNGTLIWQQVYHLNLMESVAETASGGFMLAGEIDGDLLVMKTDGSGEPIWQKSYGGPEHDYATHIIRDKENNFVMAGATYGFGAEPSYQDIYLLKIDDNGNLLWETSFKDNDQEIPLHLIELKNGDYLISGTNEDKGYDFKNAYLLRTDKDGKKLWERTMQPNNMQYKWAYSSVELPNGNIITCGHHGVRLWLSANTSDGNLLWEKEYENTVFREFGLAITTTSDGNLIVTGESATDGGSTPHENVLLTKIDVNGNRLWSQRWGGSKEVVGYSIFSGNTFTITGTNFTEEAKGKIFMLRTNLSGEVIY